MKFRVKVKKLDSFTELDIGRKIFDLTWQPFQSTEVTSNLLKALVHSGAYLSGAFIKEKCVGAALAFPATTGGLYLHSHMTAVLDKYRDNGIGYSLKIDQWNWAKKITFAQKYQDLFVLYILSY